MDETTRIGRLLQEFNLRAHAVGLLAGKRLKKPEDQGLKEKHTQAIQRRQETWNAILAEVRDLVADRDQLRVAGRWALLELERVSSDAERYNTEAVEPLRVALESAEKPLSVRAVPPEESETGSLDPVGEEG
jgi:hypothetical protein